MGEKHSMLKKITILSVIAFTVVLGLALAVPTVAEAHDPTAPSRELMAGVISHSVSGVCTGEGTAEFTITNTGTVNNSGYTYSTLETNGTMTGPVTLDLDPGDSITVPVTFTDTSPTRSITLTVSDPGGNQAGVGAVGPCAASFVVSGVCAGTSVSVTVENTGDVSGTTTFTATTGGGATIDTRPISLAASGTDNFSIAASPDGTVNLNLSTGGSFTVFPCYTVPSLVLNAVCNGGTYIEATVTNNGGLMPASGTLIAYSPSIGSECSVIWPAGEWCIGNDLLLQYACRWFYREHRRFGEWVIPNCK